MKSKLLLFLSTLVFTANLFASEGFTAFSLCRLCDPVVCISAQTGIIATVTSSDAGTVDFVFTEEQPNPYYEIRFSTDLLHDFQTEIRSRSITGFTLKITNASVDYDPGVLLYVAVDR